MNYKFLISNPLNPNNTFVNITPALSAVASHTQHQLISACWLPVTLFNTCSHASVEPNVWLTCHIALRNRNNFSVLAWPKCNNSMLKR